MLKRTSMTRFVNRSCAKEILDQDSIPFADIERNMLELDRINTWLGGHRISVLGLKQLLGGRRRIRICEIGCGGGDNLRVLSRYCHRHGIETEVVGVDINAHCIEFAKAKWKDGHAEWLHARLPAGGIRPAQAGYYIFIALLPSLYR